MNKSERHKVITQDPKERAHNFEEVSKGFDYNLMKQEAERCINCKHKPCTKACPVGVKIPDFIKLLTEDKIDEAVEIIKESNSFPAICGRVCPQEKQCEGSCVRKSKLGGSVAIGALERFVGDYALKKEAKIKNIEKNGKKVAVIGSGPAGLSCAGDCAKAGFDVTIFEAFHKMGGVLTYGIPEFRLPKKDVVEKEIETLKLLGVKFEMNTIVGKTITIAELQEEYDAIFIGTGAGLPIFMNIPGEDLNGVYSANEFLTRVNLMGAYKKDSITPIYRAKNVAVVGAGNVAMDAARTALRLGAENVYVIYRRSRDEMPARIEEIEHAEEEGIIFLFLSNPIEILGDNKVEGIKIQKMMLGEKDASGRAKPIPIDGDYSILNVDEVIISLGTSPNPLLKNTCSELNTSNKGTIIVDELTMQTSIENIYAGGDAVTGAATVILAMGAGRQAAKAIKEKLLGQKI